MVPHHTHATPHALEPSLTHEHLLPLKYALLRELGSRAARVDGIVMEPRAWADTLGQCPRWRRWLGRSFSHSHHFIGCVGLCGLFLQLKVPAGPPTHWHLWLIPDHGGQKGLWSRGLQRRWDELRLRWNALYTHSLHSASTRSGQPSPCWVPQCAHSTVPTEKGQWQASPESLRGFLEDTQLIHGGRKPKI